MRKEFELYQDEEGNVYDITTDLEQIIIKDLYKAMKRNNEKQDEIERLNTDKEQLTSLVNSCQEEIRKLKSQLQQKENIIKEVREYIESFKKIYEGHYPYIDTRHLDLNKLLEILDKENKE